MPEPAPTPRYWLSQSDAVAWMKTLPDASVDLVVTDPPYESLEKHRAVGTTTRLKHSKASSNDWFTVFPNARFEELFRETWRVMKRNTHFYLFCDQETAFVAKPIAEDAGFKFWKPLIWDKCLGPETPVWTARGTVRARCVLPGDSVATPDGRLVTVLATRRTRAPALRIALSDGTTCVASEEHRFVGIDGLEVEARALSAGTRLQDARIRHDPCDVVALEDCIDDDERVLELPDPTTCLFCGRAFDSVRAAAAHQARFCERSRSKEELASVLGVAPKRLRRWMSDGRLPASWSKDLGLTGLATGRARMRLQNDAGLWFPETIRLDYAWGKLIGLFAAEGWHDGRCARFALHEDEKHLRAHIARTVRSLGLRALVEKTGDRGCVVSVSSRLFVALLARFVGGGNAVEKHLLPATLAASPEFERGVFDGLIEGDGHWSHDEQRETFVSASLDLASFVLRYARQIGWHATMHRFENDRSGGWRVRFDPARPREPLTVVSVESVGIVDLVDLAIDDPRQLYVLGNGLVTHNCRLGMGYHYRSRYEMILFFEKGKRRLNDLGIADVIAEARIHKGYPTEKPVRVNEILISQSTVPGEIVIDPFMGTGSAGLAAVGLGRSFWGNDISDKAIAIATERLGATGAARIQAPPFPQRSLAW